MRVRFYALTLEFVLLVASIDVSVAEFSGGASAVITMTTPDRSDPPRSASITLRAQVNANNWPRNLHSHPLFHYALYLSSECKRVAWRCAPVWTQVVVRSAIFTIRNECDSLVQLSSFAADGTITTDDIDLGLVPGESVLQTLRGTSLFATWSGLILCAVECLVVESLWLNRPFVSAFTESSLKGSVRDEVVRAISLCSLTHWQSLDAEKQKSQQPRGHFQVT